MTEYGLYHVRVQYFNKPFEANFAAPDYDAAGKKAIQHFATRFQDSYTENYRVVHVEQTGSVVV